MATELDDKYRRTVSTAVSVGRSRSTAPTLDSLPKQRERLRHVRSHIDTHLLKASDLAERLHVSGRGSGLDEIRQHLAAIRRRTRSLPVLPFLNAAVSEQTKSSKRNAQQPGSVAPPATKNKSAKRGQVRVATTTAASPGPSSTSHTGNTKAGTKPVPKPTRTQKSCFVCGLLVETAVLAEHLRRRHALSDKAALLRPKTNPPTDKRLPPEGPSQSVWTVSGGAPGSRKRG